MGIEKAFSTMYINVSKSYPFPLRDATSCRSGEKEKTETMNRCSVGGSADSTSKACVVMKERGIFRGGGTCGWLGEIAVLPPLCRFPK